MKTLVVGGGQLGQALHRAIGADATIAKGVPWSDPTAAQGHLRDLAAAFIESCQGQPWFVCWSAGAGVVGTPESSLGAEREALAALTSGLSASRGFEAGLGRFFLASSAGGIYASDDGSAKTEHSVPQPTSDYGRSKLTQDEAVQQWADGHGVPTLIGRISNLYGPRQDIRKAQGFISHLCRAMANRTLFTLTVPVSTIRDFVFTDDVAARVADWATSESGAGPGVEIKLLASGRSVTLGHVIALTRAISRTPARVLLASPPGPSEQPAALRFQSRVLTGLDHAHPARSLEDGIQETWQHAMLALQASQV